MLFFLRLIWILIVLAFSMIDTSAQRPDAPTYGVRGNYAVGTRDFMLEDVNRPLTVTIWYPAQNPDNLPEKTEYRLGILRYENGRALRDASPRADDAPYPVVLFSHGSGGYRFQSTFLTEHLASYGFIVLAIDHPTNTIMDRLNRETFVRNIPANLAYRPQDMMRLIEFGDNLNVTGDFMGLLDMNTLAVIGHSLGGYTALMMGGAQLNFDKLNNICTEASQNPEYNNACFVSDFEGEIADIWGYDTPPRGAWDNVINPRIKAVIALAPWNAPIISIDPATAYPPTLIIAGSADMTTPVERDARQFYAMLPPETTTYIELDHAGHFIFVDKCFAQAIQFGFFSNCSDLVWDMDRAHDLTNHFVTAFLLDELLGDENAHITRIQDDFTAVTIQRPYLRADRRAIRILATIPHDESAFTQGLIYHNGLFYESTGLYGQSSLREVNPETGEVLRQVNLPDNYFAEGLALVDDRLIQLTWRENVAFVYDINTFEQINTYTYEGQGWGLCYDDEFLYMSNGSDIITIRDSQTFEIISSFRVTLDGMPVVHLNELECPAGENFIVANVWQTQHAVIINKETGNVEIVLDGLDLVNQVNIGGDVFNGSAYDPTTNTWYMTGKLWDTIFVVEW